MMVRNQEIQVEKADFKKRSVDTNAHPCEDKE
jgi:hypothetical protein